MNTPYQTTLRANVRILDAMEVVKVPGGQIKANAGDVELTFPDNSKVVVPVTAITSQYQFGDGKPVPVADTAFTVKPPQAPLPGEKVIDHQGNLLGYQVVTKAGGRSLAQTNEEALALSGIIPEKPPEPGVFTRTKLADGRETKPSLTRPVIE